MKVLITGNEGFIGQEVLKLLPNKFRPYLMDLKNPGKVDIRDNIPLPKDIYAIIHLAALHDVQEAEKNMGLAWDVNVNGTFNLLQKSLEGKVKKFIFASSAAAKDIQGIYGLTKKIGEDLCTHFNTLGLQTISLRLHNIYGENQKTGLFGNLLKAYRDGAHFHVVDGPSNKEGRIIEVEVYGDGKNTRDFTHVSDIANALIRALDVDYSGTLDIGNGESYSVNQVIDMIADNHFVKMKRSDELKEIEHSRADIENAKRELNWIPNIKLEDWVSETFK